MAVSCTSPRSKLGLLCCGEFRINCIRHLSKGISLNCNGKRKIENLCSFHDILLSRQHCFSFQSRNHHLHHHHQKPLFKAANLLETRHRRCPASSISAAAFPFSWHSRLHTGSHHSASQRDVPDPSSPVPDPYKLVSDELSSLSPNICKELCSEEPVLRHMSQYYFDGKGKMFRPLVALLMSKTCNIHNNIGDSILGSQKLIAMVTEMIHTASLVHDDVIDASDTRRGQNSLNKLYGQRQSILAGDYILSHASIILAKTRNTQVISILSSVMEDLVSGEFMQLGSKENENERFSHYLKKTYKKTASLLANTCKSVAILAGGDEYSLEMAFQYGRNLGIAFQLIDDLLDFVSCESVMGKPTAADLKLGLATAPVLFAAQEFPEINPMIMRRFSEEGDVELARSLVAKSDGVQQTKLLAAQHSREAVKSVNEFASSDAQKALIGLARILLDRKN